MSETQSRGFSLRSNLHPPKPKDLSKWSTWYSVARDLALDYGVRRIPQKTWRTMFNEGLTPQQAADCLQPVTEEAIRAAFNVG